MNTAELIAHIRAVAEQYEIDAKALRRGGKASDEALAVRYVGKADAFHVAAFWIEDYLTGDSK